MGKHLSPRLANFPRAFKKSLSGMPPSIVKKAKSISAQVHDGIPTTEFDSKRLTINRNVIAIKLGQRHRLLMAETKGQIEPWMCLTHEDYNKVYMRISTS